MGIDSTLRRAQDCIYRTGINTEIKYHIEWCEMHQKHAPTQQQSTPKSHPRANFPWSIGTLVKQCGIWSHKVQVGDSTIKNEKSAHSESASNIRDNAPASPHIRHQQTETPEARECVGQAAALTGTHRSYSIRKTPHQVLCVKGGSPLHWRGSGTSWSITPNFNHTVLQQFL